MDVVNLDNKFNASGRILCCDAFDIRREYILMTQLRIRPLEQCFLQQLISQFTENGFQILSVQLRDMCQSKYPGIGAIPLRPRVN